MNLGENICHEKVYTKWSSNDHNQKLNKPNVTVQGKSSVVNSINQKIKYFRKK